jgi:hypothetical protein
MDRKYINQIGCLPDEAGHLEHGLLIRCDI